MKEIKLKITIDNKEAIASLQLTDNNIRQLTESFKLASFSTKDFSEKTINAFNNARVAIQGVREAYQAIASIFAKPIEARVEFEQARVAFRVLLGDAEKAEARIKELYNFTATTPFQLNEVINASRQLEVLTRGALSSGEGLRMVGDVAAGVGARIDELSTWFGRLYDGIRNGRPVGEALQRLQELGAISGDVRSRIEELTKAGADNSEVWDVVVEAMKRYSGMMGEMSETLGGKLSNLEDNITQIQTTIGGALAKVVSPLVEHLNNLLSSVNETAPAIVSLAGVMGTLGASYTILNATGIAPLIRNLMLKKSAIEAGIGATIKQSLVNAGLVASEEAVSVATLGVAGSFRAAGVAVKSFFASLGPIGLAVMGVTALVEIIGLLGDETEEAASKAENFSAAWEKASLEDLESELEGVKEAVKSAGEALSQAKIDVRQYEQTGKSTDELRRKREYLAQAQRNYNNLVEYEKELTEEIKKRREEIRRSVESSYKSLTEKIEVDILKTSAEKQLKRAEIAYRHDVETLQSALRLKIITQKQYEERLTELTEIYERKRDEIIRKKARQNAGGLLGDINKQIRELEAQKPFAKTEEELVEIEKKINALTQKKKEIELRVKLKSEGADILDFSKLGAPKIPKVKIPTELETQPVAEDFQELQDMKLASIRNEAERERAFLDAQYQADLERYKGVIGAKEIIDKYYHEQRRELERQTIEMQMQSALGALNFIGSAINQYTVAGKGIAIANAIWNTYQAATRTMADVPYPFNIPLVAAVTAAGMAQVGKIISTEAPKVPAFAEGGRLPEGKPGYVEGWHDELIAPEKTFVEIFQQELRPKIYNEVAMKSVVIQNKELANKIDKLGDSIINRPLKAELHVGKVAARDIVKHGQKQIEREGL